MDLHNSHAWSRRQFIARGVTLASATLTIPAFLQRSAFGLPLPQEGLSSIPGVDEDRILVVIQLSGGNDGLNTVIPFGADDYYKARPGIGIRADQALKLDERAGIGLHPRMDGLKALYDEGACAIVQGVGYPNPNRSHFKSMDIWHTADTSATGDGWLGRYFDSQCCGYGAGESGTADRPEPDAAAGPAGVAIGRAAPLAMQGRKASAVSFETPDLFRWTGKDVAEPLADPYEAINRRTPPAETASNADFLTRTALDAQISSDLIRKAVALRPLVSYPGNGLARQLAMIAQMIRAGMKTRVYYATLGGFDTHAGQGAAQGNHANLLAQFSSALAAFYADLRAQENDKRVLTMTFSEFGRRVSQNASGGTDHGTAAPMFLCGPMVRPGLLSRHPSLTNLDSGDLQFEVDFRSVYAGILTDWLQADAEAVLEGRFRPLAAIRQTGA
ncbi:MAG: DUF1501 domain-containing protein [Phycisphaerales bacterium JB039]